MGIPGRVPIADFFDTTENDDFDTTEDPERVLVENARAAKWVTPKP